ncbi:MAG: AAA family ATPase [Paludibacteraceae bacterium]|nr:AAA family ATPase [Paludibacteraceae bacterium]
MLESFYKTHDYLVEHIKTPVRRQLMDDINWKDRLIAIKGGRGVGKTDFLLSYAKELLLQEPDKRRETLYVNFNNFYFTEHSLYEFAGEFVREGGKTLLIDQVFKYPNWSKELRDCFFHYVGLRIVFTASPVMRLIDGNSDIGHIVKMYNLRGYSFREYLNLQTGSHFSAFTLDDILRNHEMIASKICERIKPLPYFRDYLQYGYYPHEPQEWNYSDKVLKLMNMMIEVDVLLVNKIEVAYVNRIKNILYKLMEEVPCALNISKLAEATNTSRSTIINYIKYLKDARLLNLLYAEEKQFPMKPSRIYMQNPNLCYMLPTRTANDQAIAETFFYSALHGVYKLNSSETGTFLVDRRTRFDVFATTPQQSGFRYAAIGDLEVGQGKQIPLWLFGFLY